MISPWPPPMRILWYRAALESEKTRAQNSRRRITPPWLILSTNSLQDRDWSQRHQMTWMRWAGWNLQTMKLTSLKIRKEEVIYNNIKINKIFIIKAIRIPIIIKALKGFSRKEPLQRLVLTFIMIAACSTNTVTHSTTFKERRSKQLLKGLKRGRRLHQRYLQSLSTTNILTSSTRARCKHQHLKRTRTCWTTSIRRWNRVTQETWNSIKLNIPMGWFTSQAGNNMMEMVLRLVKDMSSLTTRLKTQDNNNQSLEEEHKNWTATRVHQNEMRKSNKILWDPCQISK